MDILSSIRGLSYSLPDLYQQVSDNGWEIKKVKYDSGRDKFVAIGKAPHDEEIEAWGPSEKVAVSNLLMHIVHRNGMRSSKLSMWTYTFTDQLTQIAEAYSKAPIYEPKAAIAFAVLGRDAEARAKALTDHLEVTMVTDPEPYANAEKMCDDIRKRRKLEVSRAGIDHPIWSDQQVIAFRIAFDVLGYCASGGDWGWEGTNRAFAAYAAMIPAEAQGALFTQVIGQTAYATYYRAYGPQKVALFPEFMDPAQSKENPHGGYRGIHPSQSFPPVEQPSVKPLVAHIGLDPIIESGMPQKLAQGAQRYFHSTEAELEPGDIIRPAAEGYDSWNKGIPGYDPNHIYVFDTRHWQNPDADPVYPNSLRNTYEVEPLGALEQDPEGEELRKLYEQNHGHPWTGNSYAFQPGCKRCAYEDQHGVEGPEWYHPYNWRTTHARVIGPVDWDDPELQPHTAHTSAVNGLSDPNEGWQSGVAPLPINAHLDHGDPLEYSNAMDNAQLIETEWAFLNQKDPADLERMKQAIINAFRNVLLSPRKNLKWNVQHSWDIRHIPANEKNPVKYWQALENARQNWNVERFGEQARFSHMPWHKLKQQLDWVIYDREIPRETKEEDPRTAFQRAQERSDMFLFRMRDRIKSKIAEDDAHLPAEKQKNGNQIELAANKEIAAELQRYLKGSQMGMDFMAAKKEPSTPEATEPMFDVAQIPEQPTPERYGAFMEGHVRAISQVGEHVDDLLKAALYDVHEHQQKGAGYHFRSAVMQLGIPGVGPKVASFAWLLLAPMTSQLATIDTHMLRVLGHSGGDQGIPTRDYFKAERQLAAGRDAAGYGPMPLGAFQWAMWDAQRTGLGTHQDHRGLRVLDSMDPKAINWEKEQPIMDDGGVTNMDWWKGTQAARDAVGEDFDQTVMNSPRKLPANQVPWNMTPQTFNYLPKAAASKLTPWLTHPQTGEKVMGLPGQTIVQHAQSLGIGIPEVWQLADVGKG